MVVAIQSKTGTRPQTKTFFQFFLNTTSSHALTELKTWRSASGRLATANLGLLRLAFHGAYGRGRCVLNSLRTKMLTP